MGILFSEPTTDHEYDSADDESEETTPLPELIPDAQEVPLPEDDIPEAPDLTEEKPVEHKNRCKQASLPQWVYDEYAKRKE